VYVCGTELPRMREPVRDHQPETPVVPRFREVAPYGFRSPGLPTFETVPARSSSIGSRDDSLPIGDTPTARSARKATGLERAGPLPDTAELPKRMAAGALTGSLLGTGVPQ
jgi:hypothetical protein